MGGGIVVDDVECSTPRDGSSSNSGSGDLGGDSVSEGTDGSVVDQVDDGTAGSGTYESGVGSGDCTEDTDDEQRSTEDHHSNQNQRSSTESRNQGEFNSATNQVHGGNDEVQVVSRVGGHSCVFEELDRVRSHGGT